MLLDIFLVLGLRRSLSEGYSSTLVVEAAVLCQQYADQEVNCGWVVGVDGSSAIEEKNSDAADKVENLPTPVDSRLVCVHDEAKIKVRTLRKESLGLELNLA